MPFEFSLTCPSEDVVSAVASEPLEDVDDYEYLVMQGCRILSEIGCRFHIAGFGSDDWGFDVSYDMSALIEQLPELLRGMASEGCGDVDFYSQGVERTVTFERVEASYVLRCRSRTSWKPSPDVEYVESRTMERMLEELAFAFSTGLAAASSEISMLEPFRSWRSKQGDLTQGI
ncbi:hypothetical protein ACFZAV_17865 [Streptomyces sp. NPDC008343]|uniref:hypothetical protein n=1 Tax=Streptomyces sp. NPDC008343 TaxID=3364828 RepID=UPI0036E3A246